MQLRIVDIIQALIINTIFLKVFEPFEVTNFFDDFIKEVQTLHT